MRIILLGNYAPDGQESMQRFAQMLYIGFRDAGIATEIWQPVPVFGALVKATRTGVGKWLGYLDKWVIFPLILRWRVRRKALKEPSVRFHICDHSNAPYLGHLNRKQAVITCHDVLAIRGSLGHADTYVSASPFGKLLQQWIYSHLNHAEKLASVSQLTMKQLLELNKSVRFQQPVGWQVIHNAFNADFKPLSVTDRVATLQQAGLKLPTSFLLHVGSDHPRKNRGLLLEMVHSLGSRWSGSICFAGEALEEALVARAEKLGLRTRVISVVKPDHATLVALYGACEAFVFPSYSEGFGWPVIEAQACGAPVIASSIEPMPEVSGGAAIHADPTKPEAFAAALFELQQPGVRARLVQLGFLNCQRFNPAHMIQAYLNLHELIPT